MFTIFVAILTVGTFGYVINKIGNFVYILILIYIIKANILNEIDFEN